MMKNKIESGHIKMTALILAGLLFTASFAACGRKTDLKMSSFIPETESTEARTKETEPVSESAEEAEEEEEVFGYYFGKRMSEDLCRINQMNQSDTDAKIADLFTERTYTAGDVLDMIGYYAFPEKAWYGERQDIQAVRDEITAYMDLGTLQNLRDTAPEDPLPVRYGILTDNASVRSFPTDLRAFDEGESPVMDYFQESKLLFADGVIVFHQTGDGVWSFVQGLNYYGWIKTQTIGFCERQEFLDYLTQDDFLIRTAAVRDDDAPMNRLGVIIPYSFKNDDGTSYTVRLPERAEDGTLEIVERVISGEDLSERYHEGFMEYSPEALISEARSMLDFPYGFGDLHSNYDCSSFAGLVYRCFGIFMPRNSGDMPHAKGLSVLDVSEYEEDAKEQLLMEHPGAVLSWPGHVMLSEGTVYGDDGAHAGIIHCNTAYYSEPDGDPSHYVVTEKVVEGLAARTYSGSGRTFLAKIQFVIWLEEDPEPSDESVPAAEEDTDAEEDTAASPEE